MYKQRAGPNGALRCAQRTLRKATRVSLTFDQPRPRSEIHRRLRRQHGVGSDILGHFGRVDLVQRVVFGVVVVEVAGAVLAEVGRGQAVDGHGHEVGAAAGLASAAHCDTEHFEFGVDGFYDRPGLVADAGRDLVDRPGAEVGFGSELVVLDVVLVRVGPGAPT